MGAEVAPLVWCFANPAGPVTAEAFERVAALMLVLTAVVALAAALAGRIAARGRTIAVVLSGGNVDADLFAKLVA